MFSGGIELTSEDSIDNIKRIIDNIQSNLVELFALFRELRRRLDSVNPEELADLPFVPLFTSALSPSVLSPSENPTGESQTSNQPPTIESTITRILAPFAREVEQSHTAADILANHLHKIISELDSLSLLTQNVKSDMTIVLKFLRFRGKNLISSIDRDKLLTRIQRWRAHLIRANNKSQ